MKRIALLLSLLYSLPILAQNPRTEIDSLAWLAGCWEGNYAGGRTITEQWMKPLGKTMLSMARTVKNGKTVEYEYVRLEQSDDGMITYIAHPSGQEEASFTLIKLEGKRVVFENLLHDFPQRVIYQFGAGDSLFARIEGKINGKEKGIDFPYRRVKCE